MSQRGIRELARHLERRPGVRVETRRSERLDGDCLRIAVAEAYGRVHDFWYDDTPEVSGYDADQQGRWEMWALEHSLRWWCSFELAPVHLAAWIGGVDSREPGYLHAIPFTYERPIVPRESDFADATIDDVRDAKWLLPAGVAMPPGRLRRIRRPLPGNPRGILYQVEGSTWAHAQARRA